MTRFPTKLPSRRVSLRPRARVRRRCRIPQNPSVNASRGLFRFSDRSQHPVPSPVLTSKPTHSPQKPSRRCPRGSSPKTPPRIPLPPRRQRRRYAPRRCELRMSPPFTQLPTFPPRRATSRRPISPLSPTPRPSFHLQTHKHEAIPAKGGAQADVSTSRDGAHPITPRGFILLVYFRARVGPSRATPDAIARTRGGTRHRATSKSLSWIRAFDSIGLGRVFSPNGDAMVEKEPVGCPDAGSRRRGSRVAGSDRLAAPSRARSVGDCERFLVEGRLEGARGVW